MSDFTGIVVGMAAEARLAARIQGGRRIATGGGTSQGAAAVARRLIADGATGLVSLGLCAGLVPAARPGDMLVPDHVVLARPGGPLRRLATDARLSGRLGGAMAGVGMLHSDDVVALAVRKRVLAKETGCQGLDMESGAVAEAAARAGLPFAVLRVICDPAERDLPPAALIALSADGRIGFGRMLGSLAGRPGQIASLIALGRDAARARATLRDRLPSFTLS